MEFTLTQIIHDFHDTETWILYKRYVTYNDVIQIIGQYNLNPIVPETALLIKPIKNCVVVKVEGENKDKKLDKQQVLEIVDFFEPLFADTWSKGSLIEDIWELTSD